MNAVDDDSTLKSLLSFDRDKILFRLRSGELVVEDSNALIFVQFLNQSNWAETVIIQACDCNNLSTALLNIIYILIYIYTHTYIHIIHTVPFQ